MASHAHFEDSDTEDDAWEPYRMLGAGSFGSAGCWVKRNGEGKVVDELAITQVRYQDHVADKKKFEYGYWKDNDDSLFTEAVIQRQLNLSSSESMLFFSLVYIDGIIFGMGCMLTLHRHRSFATFQVLQEDSGITGPIHGSQLR